jgi:DNA-binding IclR family transcriptional regulator
VFSQYIHVVQAAGPTRLHVPRGTLRPIGASGTGYAILGSMPDAEVRKIAHRINAEARLGGGEVEPVETDCLLPMVGEVRRLGYSYTSDLVTQGGALLAMALPVTDGGQPLVIGMAGSSRSFQQHRDEYVGIMRRTMRVHFPPPPMPEIRRFHSGVASTVVSASSRPWPMPTSPMPELMRA